MGICSSSSSNKNSKSAPPPPQKSTIDNNNNNNEHNNNSMAPIASTLAFGAGCYWGTEKYIVTDFQKKYPGCIANAKVGFMNPDPNGMKDPSYRQVCSGATGHVEVLNVELTKEACQTPELLEEMIQHFFMFHDPTTLNKQGNDAGTQYGSVIFTTSDEQQQMVERVMNELQQHIDDKKVTTYSKKKVTTLITPYTTFYEAQKEHQEYLEKNPGGYCNHRYRFKTWPTASKKDNDGEL